MSHHEPTARRHGEHDRVEPEQGGEHAAPLGAGRADGDHAERFVRSGAGHADLGGQRAATWQVSRAGHVVRRVDRGERTLLHQAASQGRRPGWPVAWKIR
ncbi:hypothetical protein GCM10027614_62820 [Micromonospora vulcania]